jgi:hypothetical protein
MGSGKAVKNKVFCGFLAGDEWELWMRWMKGKSLLINTRRTDNEKYYHGSCL